MEKNNNIDIGKIFLLIGGIVSFIAGFFMILGVVVIAGIVYFEMGFFAIFPIIILLLLLSVDIIGGISLLKLRNLEDDDLLENSTKILIWGIILIFTNFFGGLSGIIGYILITSSEKDEVRKDKLSPNLEKLERAYELKEKGLITEEEFEELKRKVFQNE